MIDTPEPLLRIESLHKRFEDNVVLAGASLDVPRGSLVTVLGRSGTGKSVLLKCLAGIVTPDAGLIRFDGKDLDATTRADFRRRCSFLFQSNAQAMQKPKAAFKAWVMRVGSGGAACWAAGIVSICTDSAPKHRFRQRPERCLASRGARNWRKYGACSKTSWLYYPFFAFPTPGCTL
jgi:ABC-type ATPase involved in cell division